MFKIKYAKTIINTYLLRANDNAKLNSIIKANKLHAKGIVISPLAIGRFFLIGCNLSFSTSNISLKIYTAEAINEKAINANIEKSVSFQFKNFNEKINGIKTTMFLT